MKTETGISSQRKKTWGLPSHSVYRRQPVPMIRIFLSEVSVHTLIKAVPRVGPGLAPLFLEVSGGYSCQSLGT